MEATDILKLINGAGFIAVPMVAGFLGLDWYFSRNGKSTKAIFVAVGGILSAVLYSYLAWTEPSMRLIYTSILWYFALAALAVVAYFGLYIGYDGVANTPAARWLLPASLLSYICLLSAIGLFCAAALARHDYLLLGGQVLSGRDPVRGATIILEDSNHAPLRKVRSNADGRYLLTLKYRDYEKKPDDEKPAHLLVKARGFAEITEDFDGHPNEEMTLSLAPQ